MVFPKRDPSSRKKNITASFNLRVEQVDVFDMVSLILQRGKSDLAREAVDLLFLKYPQEVAAAKKQLRLEGVK